MKKKLMGSQTFKEHNNASWNKIKFFAGIVLSSNKQKGGSGPKRVVDFLKFLQKSTSSILLKKNLSL